MSFETVSPDGNEFWADLMEIAHYYAGKYFSETKPIPNVLFVSRLDGPACCFPENNRIEIHENLRTFVKLCRFLVLHELVNHKLFKTHGKRIEYESVEFQDEIKRLWDAGAYTDLL